MRREKKRIWVYLGFLALLLEMFLTGMSVTAAQKEEQQLLEESKIIADNVYNTIGMGMLIVRSNIRQSDICKVIIKCEIN